MFFFTFTLSFFDQFECLRLTFHQICFQSAKSPASPNSVIKSEVLLSEPKGDDLRPQMFQHEIITVLGADMSRALLLSLYFSVSLQRPIMLKLILIMYAVYLVQNETMANTILP